MSGAGDAVSKREDGAGRATVPAGDDAVSEWCDGARGSVVSGAGDAVSKREDGARRATVPAGDHAVSEWCDGAGG